MPRRPRGLRTARAVACGAVGAVACARPAPVPPAAPTPATVVLVSFDGFRADYLDRRLALPAFARLEAAGVRARALIPSFPSKTFPNHWTLVTGLRPGHHGIVANTFWDPERAAAGQSAEYLLDVPARRAAAPHAPSPVTGRL